jgi:hypothetical protein
MARRDMYRQFVVDAIGWSEEDLIAAHSCSLIGKAALEYKLEDGTNVNSIPLVSGLDKIKFAVSVDDIARVYFLNCSGKIGPTMRKHIRQLALKNFWLSCLIKEPKQLVRKVFKQLPPFLANMYRQMAINKRRRRTEEGAYIIPVFDWQGIVGSEQRIKGDQTAQNLLNAKVG